jgi:hypothetical protein
MAGAVVLPGFIDVHAHWAGGGDWFVEQSWEFLVNLAFGVTTLHNPSAATEYARIIYLLFLFLFFLFLLFISLYFLLLLNYWFVQGRVFGCRAGPKRQEDRPAHLQHRTAPPPL